MQHEIIQKSKQIKPIPEVVKSELALLKNEKRRMRFLWTVFSVFIALCNVTVVVLAICVLSTLIHSGQTSFVKLGPAAFISIFTVSIFALSLVLAIFENIKKDRLYVDAINMIQHKVMKYEMQQSPFVLKTKEENHDLLIEIVTSELNRVLSIKHKVNAKKVFIKALVGDPND